MKLIQELQATVKPVITWLSGKKTYIIGVLGILYAYGISHSWWPSDAGIWGALGSTGALTIRAAISKVVSQTVTDVTGIPPVQPKP